MKFWRGLALVSSGNQRDDLSSSPFDVRAEWLPCRERRHGATRWQIYDWRRRFRSGRLAAAEEPAVLPAFVPLTVDHGPRTAPSAEIVEVAIGDILIRVGRDVSEEHLARIFRAARAAT